MSNQNYQQETNHLLHGRKWSARETRSNESLGANENLTTEDRTNATYPERSMGFFPTYRQETGHQESENRSESEFSQFKGNYEQFQQVFKPDLEEAEFERERDYRFFFIFL